MESRRRGNEWPPGGARAVCSKIRYIHWLHLVMGAGGQGRGQGAGGGAREGGREEGQGQGGRGREPGI